MGTAPTLPAWWRQPGTARAWRGSCMAAQPSTSVASLMLRAMAPLPTLSSASTGACKRARPCRVSQRCCCCATAAAAAAPSVPAVPAVPACLGLLQMSCHPPTHTPAYLSTARRCLSACSQCLGRRRRRRGPLGGQVWPGSLLPRHCRDPAAGGQQPPVCDCGGQPGPAAAAPVGRL